MWTMGTDFKYQYAHTWFRQLDKLIHYVNMVTVSLPMCMAFICFIRVVHYLHKKLPYACFTLGKN